MKNYIPRQDHSANTPQTNRLKGIIRGIVVSVTVIMNSNPGLAQEGTTSHPLAQELVGRGFCSIPDSYANAQCNLGRETVMKNQGWIMPEINTEINGTNNIDLGGCFGQVPLNKLQDFLSQTGTMDTPLFLALRIINDPEAIHWSTGKLLRDELEKFLGDENNRCLNMA